jgi:hypothetical protein
VVYVQCDFTSIAPSVTVDNGLEFEPLSTGIRYQKVAGGETVNVIPAVINLVPSRRSELHEANDSFKCWAMFRPPSANGQPTTWIPTMRYTWKWHGLANKTNGQWVLDPGVSKSGPGPLDSNNFEHPQWTAFSPSPFFLTGQNP